MQIDEYERTQALYAEFALAIASILSAAIERAGGYRLQIVRARAKDARSLRKKLADRGLLEAGEIELKVKDLAGCRAIFYTNGDVEKLIGSGLVEANFKVLDSRVHHPGINALAASQMYTANHYVVALRPDREALPEYARFAGLRCEIQLQTILNHAWAELEHDLYKAPTLSPDFGAAALDSIKQRFQDIAVKYLLPAGYEFHKAAMDLDRLVQGKELLDRNALADIARATDNNTRFSAIRTFVDHVLPLYDDAQSVLPEVIDVLVDAAQRASETPTTAIDTPFGVTAGKSFEDIAELIVKGVQPLRYLDVGRILDLARRLHRLGQTHAEREHAIALAHAVAKHSLPAWKEVGPAIQRAVADYVVALPDEDLVQELPLLVPMLEDVLGSEATGSSFSSNSVALGRGAVVASPALTAIRNDALGQLKRLFVLAPDAGARSRVLAAMGQAARPPYGAAPTRELSKILIANAVTVIEFAADNVGSASLEEARSLEIRVHRYFKRFRKVRDELADDAELAQWIAQIANATARFRTALEQLADFDAYKVLVGFDSVFAGHWEEPEPGFEEIDTHRAQESQRLLAQIDGSNFEAWLDRLERFAQTESSDLATFPVFAKFLEALAVQQPKETLANLDRIDGKLGRFVFKLLAGLLRSTSATQTHARIALWLQEGRRLGEVSWLLVAVNDVPVDLFRAVLASGIAHGDKNVVKDVIRACAYNYVDTHPQAAARQAVFIEAIVYFVQHDDASWIRLGGWFSWSHSQILPALDDARARQLLSWLVRVPELDGEMANLIAALTEHRPILLLDFLDQRLEVGRTEESGSLVALPCALREATRSLSQIPADTLTAARRWFDAAGGSLDYSVERLIEAVFGDFPPVLIETLHALLSSGQRVDALFALEVLAAFEGQAEVFALAREAAAHWGDDEDLASHIHLALAQEGGTNGFYGRVKALQAKRARLEAWLADPRDSVVRLAREEAGYLEQRIASETKRTQATLAHRRMQYGEPPMAEDSSIGEPPTPDSD